MNNIKLQRIWMTGASSTIGRALAEELLSAGHHVALTARSLSSMQDLESRYPGQTLLAPGDLNDGQQVTGIGDRIAQVWGALDCAVIHTDTCEYPCAKPCDALTRERVLQANLLATSYCVQEALLLLRHGDSPHLVGICAASRTFADGMRAIFESLRADVAHEGIDVTVVSPGITTDAAETAIGWPVEKIAAQIAVSLQRQQRPLEIVVKPPFIHTSRLLTMLPDWLQSAVNKHWPGGSRRTKRAR